MNENDIKNELLKALLLGLFNAPDYLYRAMDFTEHIKGYVDDTTANTYSSQLINMLIDLKIIIKIDKSQFRLHPDIQIPKQTKSMSEISLLLYEILSSNDSHKIPDNTKVDIINKVLKWN